jgi:hypothetical protein
MLHHTPKQTTGDCEFCERTNVVLTLQHGDMMCENCIADEAKAVKTVEESQAIDSSIQVKSDVFVAQTVAFVELDKAIQSNPAISSDMKGYTLAKLAAERIDQIGNAIFVKKAELAHLEDEHRKWLVDTHIAVSKLRPELRSQFAQYNIDYKPASASKVKKIQPARTGKSFDKKAVYEAAKKYNVPAAQIQSMVITRNMSPEVAAKTLSDLLN